MRKKKVRVSPQHDIKAQVGSRRITLLVLNLDARSRSVASATRRLLFPRKVPLHTVQKAICATGPLWMDEENRKSVTPTGVLTPNRPDGSKSYKVNCHSEYHEDLRKRGFIVERILQLGQVHASDALS